MPYTYKIINPGPGKVEARIQIGKMAADMIDVVATDLLQAGFSRYLQYLGYSQEAIKEILNGPKLETSINIDKMGLEEIQGSPEVSNQVNEIGTHQTA